MVFFVFFQGKPLAMPSYICGPKMAAHGEISARATLDTGSGLGVVLGVGVSISVENEKAGGLQST